jgi:CheY-like chemotaxis protein
MNFILIVDDDPDMAELLGHMIDILGHQHRFVRTAAQALQACRERQPDAVILDIMLEETDGWALYDELAKITHAPIIFITAWRTSENRRKAAELQADGFLAKPISHQEFAGEVQRALSQPANRLARQRA